MAPRISLLAAALALAALAPSRAPAIDDEPAATTGAETPIPDGPYRPRIKGISQVALWVRDLGKARAFYEGYLGFDEPKDPSGNSAITWLKVNDRQSIELFPVNADTPKDGDSLYHLSLEIDESRQMLAYLKFKGVKGPGGKPLPDIPPTGKLGNRNFFIEDPDGHIVEFTEFTETGQSALNVGMFLPTTRVAASMSHAGIISGNLEASLHFYRDILGFKEFWRGSSDGKTLSWVNLRVPDGPNYIELMLYGARPSLEQLHVLNHLCLEVDDVGAAAHMLKGRPFPEGSRAASEIRTGKNAKRQINCFDPDGTRVEIMEENTVDGEPAPSSESPPPAGHIGTP
jgi:lactoylglutathione lyase